MFPKTRLDCQRATLVARVLREQIRTELQLTASAGVAPNKFLAKIASDWKKPDGLFVIQPEEVDSFLIPLPVGRVPGVGRVTEEKLKSLGVQTIGDLRRFERSELETPSRAREAKETFAYNLSQILRILDVLPLLPKAAVATASFVGLREGELRGLEWQDYSGTEITVSRACIIQQRV